MGEGGRVREQAMLGEGGPGASQLGPNGSIAVADDCAVVFQCFSVLLLALVPWRANQGSYQQPAMPQGLRLVAPPATPMPSSHLPGVPP